MSAPPPKLCCPVLPDSLTEALASAAASIGDRREPPPAALGREVAREISGLLESEVYAVILYGSRARGTATAESDWDVLVLTGEVRSTGIFGESAGMDVDLHALPKSRLATLDPGDYVYLLPCVVLFDTEGLAADLLASVARRAEEPPPRMTRSEVTRFACWLRRMGRRIRRDLAEAPAVASYRLAWLEFELYDRYFRLRGLRTMAAAASIAHIRRHDPECARLIDQLAAAREPIERLTLIEVIAEHALSGAVCAN